MVSVWLYSQVFVFRRPIFALEIKANLVGVTDLRPEDYENFRWYLKLKCTQCGEVTENWVYADITEAQELSKGHGIGHIVGKCSFCARQNTVEILTDSYKSYSVEKNEQFQPIVRFECRGAEPVDFDFRVGWRAEGIESSTVFEDIDLNEKEWADYDEKAGESTEINELSCRFTHQKK
ncbi:hypothetical protein QR680_004924 [Steinernema hermaphroditum]|uniref:CXXC motif containing zinc binding protein n=1 Tax=Steinernema hermaphroditum TaxID=289476 RepID=A0AA39HQ94_9BILA|nr:hypothetical protein QR680_004924 [Steinernema hermaphroditum]